HTTPTQLTLRPDYSIYPQHDRVPPLIRDRRHFPTISFFNYLFMKGNILGLNFRVISRGRILSHNGKNDLMSVSLAFENLIIVFASITERMYNSDKSGIVVCKLKPVRSSITSFVKTSLNVLFHLLPIRIDFFSAPRR